jgi:hypothetical protein
MPSVRPSLFLALGLACACGGSSPEPETASDVALRAARGPAADVYAAAGSEGALTVAFDPKGWPELQQALLGALPERALEQEAILGKLRGARDPWVAATHIAGEMGLQLPQRLLGWDRSKPLVLSLLRVRPANLSEVIAQVDATEHTAAAAHRAVVPATDSKTLLQSLQKLAEQGDCKPAGALIRQHLDASVKAFVCDEHALLTLERQSEWVIADWVELSQRNEPPAWWVARRQAPEGRVSKTAARDYLRKGEAPVRAQLRPQLLARFAEQETAAMLRGALREHARDPAGKQVLQPRIWLAGMSELLQVHLARSPARSEVDELAFGLSGSPALRAVLLASLTDHGRKLLEAGGSSQPEGAAPDSSPDAPVVLRTPLDLASLGGAAELPPGLPSDRPEAVRRLVRNLGKTGTVALALRYPIALGGASLSTEGASGGIGGTVSGLVRVEPAERQNGVLAEGHVDLHALGTRVRQMVATLLPGTRRLRMRQTLSRHTTLAEFVLGDTPFSTDASAWAHAGSSEQEEQDESDASSRGEQCLGRFGAGLATALRSASHWQPGQQADALSSERIRELQRPLRCALQHPETQDRAEALRELMLRAAEHMRALGTAATRRGARTERSRDAR